MKSIKFCLDAELADDFENMVFSIARTHAKPVLAPEIPGNHFIGLPILGFGPRAIHINSEVDSSAGRVSYDINFIDLPREREFVGAVTRAYNFLARPYSPEQARRVVAIS